MEGRLRAASQRWAKCMTDVLNFSEEGRMWFIGQPMYWLLNYLFLLNESDRMTEISCQYGWVVPACNHTRTALHIAPMLAEYLITYKARSFYLNINSLQQPHEVDSESITSGPSESRDPKLGYFGFTFTFLSANVLI